ncbi:hypothetical protein ACI0FN_01114 [Alcaligenes nematophilus]|uniref:hypothetical protein n=1 Tax=Alcaligenes nematophilus TaxID=2994643 RepID=UPI0038514396
MDNTWSTVAAGGSIAIIGWYVVNYLTIRRERDKLRRESLGKSIENLLKITDELIDLANEYHTKERDHQTETKIIIKFNRLSNNLNHLPILPKNTKNTEKTEEKLIIFKKEVTGIHFEDEHTGPLPHKDERIYSIQSSASDLEDEISQLYQYCYRPIRFIELKYWCGPCK